MKRLTMQEVKDDYGGILPPDAILRSETEELTLLGTSSKRSKPRNRRTRSERFAVLNAFTDFALADLTSAETKVWLILFRDTKREGTARTGQADLARRAGLKQRMVRYALTSLEAKGMLRVIRRGRLNAGPSVYRVQSVGNS